MSKEYMKFYDLDSKKTIWYMHTKYALEHNAYIDVRCIETKMYPRSKTTQDKEVGSKIRDRRNNVVFKLRINITGKLFDDFLTFALCMLK